MNDNYKKLASTLRKIFEIDKSDLDFGIYRILNQKREEISNFLEKDLLLQVKEEFKNYSNDDISEIKAEIKNAIEQARKYGSPNPEEAEAVLELKEKLNSAADINSIEQEVFSHLHIFLSRYYEKGDFISLRRYKSDTYAIPYDGEELKLHWANHDQYYVKSSEHLKDYTFTVKSQDNKTVRIKLVEADIEKDNTKISGKKERRFSINKDIPLSICNDELLIHFNYTFYPRATKQTTLNQESVEYILSQKNFPEWIQILKEPSPTEKNKKRTVLEKHLNDYTARNTFDYFIHKDLKSFLLRELDFYIKNEIFQIDDIDNLSLKQTNQIISKIKCIKKLAEKIINFLAQSEDFQKRMWLKKKFVVSENFCLPFSELDTDTQKYVLQNKRQRDEWIELGLVEEKSKFAKVSDVPPNILVDTSNFDESFKINVLKKIEDQESYFNGLLVNGENAQALRFLQEKYKGKVDCVYIDPPFNLGENGDFLYKTNYLDSSWLTMLRERIIESKSLLKDTSKYFVRCDDHGNYLVRMLCDGIFGRDMFQDELLVQRIRKNVTTQGRISMPLANDSLFLYFNSKSADLVDPFMKLEKTREAYWRRIDDSAGFRNPPERFIFGKKFMPYKADAHFKYSQDSIDRMITEKKIRLKCKECKAEHYEGEWKKCPECGSEEATPHYLVAATDTKILDSNWMDIPGYSSTTGFSTENSEKLLERALTVGSAENDLVLDYFSGSGTTLAVAQKLGRRWIGVEVGKQFEDYIIPRMKKIAKDSEARCAFKYIKLEGYEDTLNNLELTERDGEQISLLSRSDSLKESYMLSYLLDFETADSSSLLNINKMRNPFAYKLMVSTNSVGVSKEAKIDLVSSFNYFIGLSVRQYDVINGVHTVVGSDQDGEDVLVIWRNIEEVDNEKLEVFMKKLKYHPSDTEFSKIFINGDHTLNDPHSKVHLIESVMKKNMFEPKGV